MPSTGTAPTTTSHATREAGTRFGLADNIEFVLEGNYSFALNSVFSSSVIRDNEFTIDNLVAQFGVGYRF